MTILPGMPDTHDYAFWQVNFFILIKIIQWEGYDLRVNETSYLDVDHLRQQGAVLTDDLGHDQWRINSKRSEKSESIKANNDVEMWRHKAHVAEVALAHLHAPIPKDPEGDYDLNAMRKLGMLPPRKSGDGMR